jgi:DNA anti-recombination protein RmuC
MMGWWAVARAVGPWVAVCLLLGMAWQCGAHNAAKRSTKKITRLEIAAQAMERSRDEWKAKHEQLSEDLDASNERIRAQAEEYANRVDEMHRANSAEVSRLATSYSRRLEEAHAESSDLRERVTALQPGEACLEVMKELSNAFN